MSKFYRLVFLWAFVCLSHGVLATLPDIDWEKANRQPVRSSIRDCRVYLSPADPRVNESVGVLISENRIPDFEEQLTKVISERGKCALYNGHLYVTGVPMGKEKEVRDAYYAALARHGYNREDVRVRVLSIPQSDINWMSREAFKGIYQRLLYFFPSIARDYQSPIKSELVTGLFSDAAVEVSNIVFLYQTLPTLDANLTVGTHAVVLGSYAIYKKFLINWLLRPGSNHLESFLKQVSLSFPFVANYSIFGKFSQIMSFYTAHGWLETAKHFPHELENFATTQGFTMFLQTLFYNMVITKGVRGWENSQVGTDKSNAARAVSNLVPIPILSFDAVFLAMASSNKDPLFSLGVFDINAGHGFLGLLTVVGSTLWLRPQLLNPTINWYNASQSALSAFRRFLGKAIGRPVQSVIATTEPEDTNSE